MTGGEGVDAADGGRSGAKDDRDFLRGKLVLLRNSCVCLSRLWPFCGFGWVVVRMMGDVIEFYWCFVLNRDCSCKND